MVDYSSTQLFNPGFILLVANTNPVAAGIRIGVLYGTPSSGIVNGP